MKKFTLLFILLIPTISFAQQYSIDWHKVAGGGGTSTNGQYSVSGTIGQPDASGAMTAGQYSVTGGFWSLINVVQTPGAPTLHIFLTTTNTAILAWPYPSAGFTLQVNTNPATTNWLGAGGTVNIVGGENQVTVSPPVGNLFFRLKK